MPPERRPLPRFVAEPPQEPLPTGRWADTLGRELRVAAAGIELELDEIHWFPDRTWAARTYVPATASTTSGLEVFGYVSYGVDDEPGAYRAVADVAEETAADHPEWRIDLCDEVLGPWRGHDGDVAQMTLVWGVSLVDGATTATAELGGRVTTVVDQCPLLSDRFTLVAADDYRGDTLTVRVWDGADRELAAESLYED